MLSRELRERAVNDLVEMVKFPTVSGDGPINGSYDDCAAWILSRLTELGLDCSILPESLPHKPLVVGKWEGSSSEMPGILLNSHYDVVPVIQELWTVPCFEGLRVDGRIYGRGTQDMKCVCVQYIAAIQALKDLGIQPLRSIYLSFVPDEEIAVALDEGLASEEDDFCIFYGERLPWWVSVVAKGNTGHASRFIEGTAVEQIIGFSQKALDFRRQQKEQLHGGPPQSHNHAGCSHSVARKKTLGDVTSLNLTVLRAGVQAGGIDAVNVVPTRAEAILDIRIPPHVPPSCITATLDSWCREVAAATPGASSSVGLSWSLMNDPLRVHHVTSTDPVENVWWSLFNKVLLDQCGIKTVPAVFPAATDSRFLRALGVRAIGFSPIRRSPILLHEHDEYLDEDVFIEGCEIYTRIILAMANFHDDSRESFLASLVDVPSAPIDFEGVGDGALDEDGEVGTSATGCPMGHSLEARSTGSCPAGFA